MITFRRNLLDRRLMQATSLMRGRVLDVGGKKLGRRGVFTPPRQGIDSWLYLNTDPSTNPDLQCPAEAISLPDHSIDTVICTEVLEYSESPEALLSELYRVLAPSGICILSSPLLLAIHGDPEGDRQRFTETKLKELFEKTGFQLESLQALGSTGAVIHDLLHVSLGYSSPNQASTLHCALRLALRASVPLFRLLDSWTAKQSRFINTGYFAVLRKPTP